VDNYKKANGTDAFYKMGEGTVRYRYDVITARAYFGPRVATKGPLGEKPAEGSGFPDGKVIQTPNEKPYTMFTVKERRSDNNLLNRKEVDLKIDATVKPEDVEAFMKMMKADFQYKIKKDYEIWDIVSAKEGVRVCFAMYDVKRPNGTDKRRFVEVEIERDSTCTAKEGRDALQLWIPVLRQQFGFEAPANVSLYELYGK
jgi:hypothetical protein